MAEAFDRYAGYQKMRQRVQQDVDASKQQMGEAIKRKFASMGNLNSGAQMKIEQKANAAADVQARAATEGVDFAEQQERARQADITQAQGYQTSEREAAQKFASGERIGQQDFQRGMFDRDMTFKDRAFDKQHDLAFQEFLASKDANHINALIGLANADLDDGDFAKILGQLGSIQNKDLGGRPPTTYDPSNPRTLRHPQTGIEYFNPNYDWSRR